MLRGKNLAFIASMLLSIVGVYGCDSSQEKYTFLVAGHAYGSHIGGNVGLYEKLIEPLTREKNNGAKFVIFAGDVVRRSKTESWDEVSRQMYSIGLPYYIALGNHDAKKPGREFVEKKFGSTFYAFDRGTEKFIILDVEKHWGIVPTNQIKFLDKELSKLKGIKNIFIIFHELIWTQGSRRYRHVHQNFITYNGLFHSNYWPDVFPRLTQLKDVNIYVIAGDVGGNPGVYPAFYDKYAGIHYIATGMGQVEKENYLRIEIRQGKANFEFVSLSDPNIRWPLERFNFDNVRK